MGVHFPLTTLRINDPSALKKRRGLERGIQYIPILLSRLTFLLWRHNPK